MKALLLLHSEQLVFFPRSNTFKNSREISVELNDLEHAKKKLIVSFFQVKKTNPDLDLNLQDAIRVNRRVGPGENYRYSCQTICCMFILRKIKCYNH